MKDAKFRVWDGNNNKYEYPDIIEIGKGIDYEQYIGLKDKNGKEIYEGDIVRYLEWFDGFGDYSIEKMWVATLECNKFSGEYTGGADGAVWYTDIEIIGNIHEENA